MPLISHSTQCRLQHPHFLRNCCRYPNRTSTEQPAPGSMWDIELDLNSPSLPPPALVRTGTVQARARVKSSVGHQGRRDAGAKQQRLRLGHSCCDRYECGYNTVLTWVWTSRLRIVLSGLHAWTDGRRHFRLALHSSHMYILVT